MKSKTLSKDFTTGNIPRQLFWFMLPFMASNGLQVLYSTIDMIIVGKYVGTPGLSAVSQSSLVLNFVTMVCLGFSNAGQVLIAQALGAKKRKEMNTIIGTLFSVIVCISVVCSAIILLGRTWIVELMNIPNESYDMSLDYLTICGAGLIFTAGYNMVSAVLRGMGDSKRPFLFIGIASVINLVLDIIFTGMLGWVVVAALGVIGVLFGIMFALFTLGLSLGISLLGGVVAFFGFKCAVDANKGVDNNTRWKNEIKDNNPDFSEEDFIGSLDCKLKSIHYASTPQELAAFVKCDIAPFVKSYQNIINCETGKISFKNYRIEGDYQYLDIHREIEVLQDCDTHLQPARGVVGVTLAKRISYKLKNDVTLYRCNGCGASISLVEGGKCTYCGNEMDYATYDWIVVGYRHVDAL